LPGIPRIVAIFAVLALMSGGAEAQQPPAPLYSITLNMQLSLTGKAAADMVNALANSDVSARIAVPLINEISAQIGAQNEAMAVAVRKAADDAAKAKAAEEAAKASPADPASR
jgi:hypothetical protein